MPKDTVDLETVVHAADLNREVSQYALANLNIVNWTTEHRFDTTDAPDGIHQISW